MLQGQRRTCSHPRPLHISRLETSTGVLRCLHSPGRSYDLEACNLVLVSLTLCFYKYFYLFIYKRFSSRNIHCLKTWPKVKLVYAIQANIR